MSRTAVVTGATSGIGAAFARRLSTDGYALTIVARDGSRLAAMADELPGPTTPLVADLSTEEGCAAVEAVLAGPVDVLVNNAGMTLGRSFLKSSVEDEARLIRLNVQSVMRLTHAVLPGMKEREHGAVINVSSVAGFGAAMPGSTYSASKAWVTNFSDAIGQLMRPFNVRVMALCPGYTRTEFHDRAGIDMSKTPGWMWLRADDVVDAALRDLARGKLVSVPDWKYKATVFGMRHAPRGLVGRVSRDTRGRIGRSEA